jgi:hypothetical protein
VQRDAVAEFFFGNGLRWGGSAHIHSTLIHERMKVFVENQEKKLDMVDWGKKIQ